MGRGNDRKHENRSVGERLRNVEAMVLENLVLFWDGNGKRCSRGASCALGKVSK